MKKLLCMQFNLLVFCSVVFPQFKPANGMSSIKFHVRNFGIRTDGHFKTVNGTIIFDTVHPMDAKFDISVDAASIDTDNSLRDEHLRGEEYFDVNAFPVISFVSRQVTVGVKPGMFNITGDLAIKGHSKTISFPFLYSTQNGKLDFTGAFNINRKDFDIGGSSVISDSVSVELNVIAEK